jgi:hypothetical protein
MPRALTRNQIGLRFHHIQYRSSDRNGHLSSGIKNQFLFKLFSVDGSAFVQEPMVLLIKRQIISVNIAVKLKNRPVVLIMIFFIRVPVP